MFNMLLFQRWVSRLICGCTVAALTLVGQTAWAVQVDPVSTKKPVKGVAKPLVRAASKPLSKSRQELNAQANQMAAGVRAADAALSPAELAIAQRVEVGTVACELGASVMITADAKIPGYFDVQGKTFRFRMAPVVTSTGAIRLEDAQAGAVWLQLANKSMLMSQKLGSRLADACVTEQQAKAALAMEKNPPPSLFDAAGTSGNAGSSAATLSSSTVVIQ